MLRLRALLFAAVISLSPAVALADPVDDARTEWQAAVASGGQNSPGALMAEWEYANALSHAARYAEAVPVWRRMVGVAEQRVGPENQLLVRLRIQMAMDLIQTHGEVEAEQLLLAALPHAEDALGANAEMTMLGQAALATIRMGQGRYDEAETPARIAFDIARVRDGGARVAPIAIILRQIYINLGRETDAREVMALADPSSRTGSSQQFDLANLRAAGDWTGLAATARTAAAERRASSHPLDLALAEEAELDLVDALSAINRAGGRADYDEALRTARAVRIAREERRADGWGLARAMNAEADLLLFWPGHEDPAAGLELKGRALAAAESDVGPRHPAALNQRLIYGMLLFHNDPQAAAPVLAEYYQAALDGEVPADDWARGATLLAGVMAQAGEPALAYGLTRDAAAGLHAYVRAPERGQDARAALRTNSSLFRAQVEHAWGYGEGM